VATPDLGFTYLHVQTLLLAPALSALAVTGVARRAGMEAGQTVPRPWSPRTTQFF